MGYIYLNASFISEVEARIPVSDRGFRFGDGVFETIRITRGRPLFLARHLARLGGGLEALGISVPGADLATAVRELIHRNGTTEGFARLAVSRGSGSMGYLPTHETPPTVAIETLPPRPVPEEPVSLWLSRWRKPAIDVLPVQYKLAQGVNSTLARMEAREHGCFEALQLNAAGEVCEASAANVFWLEGDTLYTPALECGVLAGIARAVLIEAAPVKVAVGHYPLDALLAAEAVFLTNVAHGPLPVASLQPQGREWPPHPLAGTLADVWRGACDASLD